MLTDYHVHLRPDDPGTTAEQWFTPANAERYRETAAERGITELGVSEHVYRFRQALQIWQHPFWREWAHEDLHEYVRFVREETDLRLGLELDFIPGREDHLANLLEGVDWDYVVGSVHFVGDFAVDLDDEFDVWRRAASPEEVWRRYFGMVAEAARSGLYDIMAHPDLVKVWGSGRPDPAGDPRRYYEPVVEAFADAGVAVEVSTAGLRKRAGEIYPSRQLLEMLVDAGCPLALSSDAHEPDQLAHRYEAAVELLDSAGVREIAVFERRERRMEPLG
jgi:histidinol-phosphatase (PHP family)